MTEGSKNSLETTNRYELVMVAAREARRLNDRFRERGIEPKFRVTTEAISRASKSGVEFRYGTPPAKDGEDYAAEGPLADVEPATDGDG